MISLSKSLHQGGTLEQGKNSFFDSLLFLQKRERMEENKLRVDGNKKKLSKCNTLLLIYINN